MNYIKHIEINPDIMLGKPVIKGTRVTLESILKKMADGATVADIVSIYPNLNNKDVYAALNYASLLIANEEIIFSNAS
tara:strand:+ start:41220 stop:41453 length:234 start_codon:yes stop_codon:yes gene_type:complete